MIIQDLLEEYRKSFSTEREKGTAFEKLTVAYLRNEPKYKELLENVWMWKDFPYRGNMPDIGIDLVAKTNRNEYWAIQCKFYDESYEISKADVDTFLSVSSKFFYVNEIAQKFSYRLIVSTTNKYNKNAEETILNQDPPVGRIGLESFEESQIDWKKYSLKKEISLVEQKKPLPHQKTAIEKVLKGFENYDRGKLIMACGTGKTFTSLRIAEEQLKGKGNILFLVPSIALASQALTEWTAQTRYSFNAAVVCSDNKASKGEDSVDLGYPSTTNIKRLKEWINENKKSKKNLNFIFSTYQSIDVISELQKETNLEFDIIICDEAHRTTGVTLCNEDKSYFVKIHDNNFIKAKKRLYMTATPRIFGDAAKGKAVDENAEICSMDDETKYGPEFHRLNFSEAVKNNLLTDYKVLVLAVDEEYVKAELQDLLKNEDNELALEDSVKIMGCWNGLSKLSTWDEKNNFLSDPYQMKRAVAFSSRIEDSKKLVEMFKLIQKHVKEDKYSPNSDKLVHVDIKHVDGGNNALEKKSAINWLKDDIPDGECRILTNAKCLSEGVDVPALDAVMFLNPRSSVVDIIQSVGRVMRKNDEKKYGYIILPIGVSATENPDEALNKNKKYQLVWEILQALRAHDDRFNNMINKIDLNKKKPEQVEIIGIGKNKNEDSDSGYELVKKKSKQIEGQITLDFDGFDKWKDSIYAKMVKKVGSKVYWEIWAKDIAEIATSHMTKMHNLINKDNPEIQKEVDLFVKSLQNTLNASITRKDAIEMLAQHMITKPVFDALFENYEFVKNNPVSKTMQRMIDVLDKEYPDEEKETMNNFYDSVKERAQGIDNAEGKQKIILELYEKFFKIALPSEVEKLGIVYTRQECVDFIINSVEYLMKKEFNRSLSNHGVHIIDGFTGTGTFIVRLLQSGVIKKEDLLYKYTNDIHANEIVLLAYYIATINIEEAFHELSSKKQYTPFDGVVLTDTFELYEENNGFNNEIINDFDLKQNKKRAEKQKKLPITVCIGNPPYSVGQKSQNDNAQNLKYPILDSRIANTYVKNSSAQLNKALYDPYIKAFRWASDRIEPDGIISFITNGAFIDNKGMDGFRKSLLNEFTSIYVFNLRGNAYTSGEQRRKEKDNVFGQGSRTLIAITCLVKNSHRTKDNFIHYSDIGDYLSREEKLNKIHKLGNISNIKWEKIKPDDNNDWINKKDETFEKFIPLFGEEKSIFTICTSGVTTARDSWVYNFNKETLKKNMTLTIDTYNKEIKKGYKNINDIKNNVTKDETKISWSRALLNSIKNGQPKQYDENDVTIALYRPFCNQWFYYSREFNECQYKTRKLFKNPNPTILITGSSSGKGFSALMTNKIFNYHTLSTNMAFPLHYYEENTEQISITNNYKKDGISDWIQEYLSNKYSNVITKESIFYYVYALLHSKDYKNRFSADLNKSIPRIPFPDTYDVFEEYQEAGKKLANLHLNYEKVEKYKKCEIIKNKDNFRVRKMKFTDKAKSSIEFNENIIIKNIPSNAYEYTISGKSAIEWIMERYSISEDKKSGIINNPNDWCIEVNNEKYIFDLLLKIINLSIKTIKIVDTLPKIDF